MTVESERVTDSLHQLVNLASTGVGCPSEGLPANLHVGEDSRHGSAAGLSHVLAVILSPSVLFSRRLSDSYQDIQTPSSCILIGVK